MSTTTPTKRALRQRLQAARMQERALPDLVRRAYGEMPDQAKEGSGDEPGRDEQREAARTALVDRGHLTREELDALGVDEAIGAARQRLREQMAALQEQTARQADEKRGQDTFLKPPRTLRRR